MLASTMQTQHVLAGWAKTLAVILDAAIGADQDTVVEFLLFQNLDAESSARFCSHRSHDIADEAVFLTAQNASVD